MENTQKPSLWSGPSLVFWLSIVFASVTDSTLINVLPVYMQDTVGSNLATGWMITGLTVASMVTRLVCGPLTDQFGRKRLADGRGTAVAGQLLQVLDIERAADDRWGVAMSTYSLLDDAGSGAGGLAQALQDRRHPKEG